MKYSDHKWDSFIFFTKDFSLESVMGMPQTFYDAACLKRRLPGSSVLLIQLLCADTET